MVFLYNIGFSGSRNSFLMFKWLFDHIFDDKDGGHNSCEIVCVSNTIKCLTQKPIIHVNNLLELFHDPFYINMNTD